MTHDNISKTELLQLYEEIARCYPEEEHVYSTLSGILRRRFVCRILRTLSGSLLEVGCNRGMYLAEYRNGLTCGVDIAVSALQDARRRCPDSFFVKGDAECLFFFKLRSFRNVLVTETMEHLLHVEAAVRGMAHVLGDGLLITTTPNFRGVRPLFARFGRYREYGIKRDSVPHTAYKPEELRALLERVGELRVIETGTFAKETRVCQKLAILFLNVFRISHDRGSASGYRTFHRAVLLVYHFLKWTCVLPLIQACEKEGQFSYAIARRNHR